MSNERIEMIRSRINDSLSPESIEIEDQSHMHVGHAGAASGGGHFDVKVISTAFDGKSLIERHRMVYAAVGDAMKTEIHALSIKAITPDEANS